MLYLKSPESWRTAPYFCSWPFNF